MLNLNSATNNAFPLDAKYSVQPQTEGDVSYYMDTVPPVINLDNLSLTRTIQFYDADNNTVGSPVVKNDFNLLALIHSATCESEGYNPAE